jgi:hypothetical protein
MSTKEMAIAEELTEMRGDELFVVVRSPSVETLMTPAAKKLAYDYGRGQNGFGNAGIEAYGSVLPEHIASRERASDDRMAGDPDPDAPTNDAKMAATLPPETVKTTKYLQTYKLTRGL